MVAMIPALAMAEIESTTVAKRVSRVLGFDLHSWEQLMLLSLGAAALAAVAVVVTTAAVVVGTRDENARTRLEFETYQIEAGKQAAKSDEHIAELNNQTERLKGENLALQTVLLPRHIRVIGVDKKAIAFEWFTGLNRFSGMRILIQRIPDAEAEKLSDEIAIVLSEFGWEPEFATEEQTQIPSSRINEGVRVGYPLGEQGTVMQPDQPWFRWKAAAEALADALTKAGLGGGARPVGRHGMTQPFNPPLEGVYVQVGQRPVASTIEWIRQGRPDVLGNEPAPETGDKK